VISNGNFSAGLNVSAGRADITPNEPQRLSGFVSRRANFKRVNDRLEVNGALLGDGVHRVLFLSFDLLYVGPGLSEALTSYCAAQYGVENSAVFLTASHTHFAPSTDETKPLLGEANAAYIHDVEVAAKRLVDELFSRQGKTVELQLLTTHSDAAVNRRLMRWIVGPPKGLQRTAVIAPNPDGPVDRAIYVLAAKDGEGAVSAVFWNYACHPVAFPRQT